MQIHSTLKYFTIAYIHKRVVAWRHTLWRKEQRCPHAIYHARTIYNPNNKASPIKYQTKISPTIISHDDLSFNLANPQTPSQFARNFRWETLRWNILGARLFLREDTQCPPPIFVYIKYMKIITTLCQENIKLTSLHNLWFHTSLCVYSRRRDVTRRYKQRNHIQQ